MLRSTKHNCSLATSASGSAGNHAVFRTLAIVVCLCLTQSCAPGFSRGEPENFPQEFRADAVIVDGLEVHYVESGIRSNPLTVFVHGTPGSWRAFEGYLRDPRLVASLHMIAVDRMGFGKSAAAGPHPSFEDQARSISALFNRNESGLRVLVVGHSLGGSIGLRVAVDYPDDVGALLVISSAISPQLSRPRWYNRLANLPVIRWLVPEDLTTANAEMMPLAEELAAMEQQLRTLPIPVTVMQGMKDSLVAPGNADYVEATLRKAELRVMRFPEIGHFLIWEQPDVVTDEILRLAREIPGDSQP